MKRVSTLIVAVTTVILATAGLCGCQGGPASGVAFATTTLECNGRDYVVSTGNGSGKCTHGVSDGIKFVNCNSSTGNAAAHCAQGCGGTDGQGSCLKARQ
jgi:hypothetical protein